MSPYGDKFQPDFRDPILGLRWQVGLTKLAMTLESAMQAFWPLVSLVLFTYGFVALGGLAVIPTLAAQGLLAVFGIGMVWFLVSGLRRFRLPDDKTALARLDQGLKNSPIAALQDQPALNPDDPVTKALWQEHIDQMRAAAMQARTSPPEPQLAGRDPTGLRLMAIIVAIVAISFAPKPDLNTIIAAATGESAIPSGPSFAIEAWATPPAYTGKPALYLTEIALNSEIKLPVGSEITLRFYGDASFALTENISGATTVLPQKTEDMPVRDVQFSALENGQITLKNGDDILGQWQVVIIPDLPPTLQVPDGVEKTGAGVMELAYLAQDDYGIDSARLVITPDLSRVDRRYGLRPDPIMPDAYIRDLPMPFSNDRTKVKDTYAEDFSPDLWAHLPVDITLEVTDGSGQTAIVVLAPQNLPARSFFDPLAAGIAESRRDLLWSAENDLRVSQVLRAMTHKPEEGLFPSSSSYLLTRSTIRRMGYQMEDGFDEGERAEITELLWLIATLIEDGDLSGAEARLRRAQERLAQGLENGANDEEMAELMDELREATDEYLQQLAQEAGPPEEPQPGQETRTMTMDQLQQMLDRLQELTENGQTEEARQMLEQLREFMENMQVTNQQPQPGQGGQEQQNLQDSLEQQQQLSDEAFQQLQQQLEQGQDQDGEALAERQEALRQFLDDMRGQSDSDEANEAIDEAERNMGEARDRLDEGDFSGALDEQAEVMENLRQGLRDLQNREQADQSGEDGQQSSENDQRDPLGRPIGSQGRVDNGDTEVPDQNAEDRARELMEEIRRRSGDAERPVEELDYLRRLLERF
ncbi:MAG: DUF4175 domain-containing protein [Rhodobacteraceae bacterium]|nr:DUF4175 domain-containing protein [Paracoccaceae bacterium]